jgi:hypothetical protein
MGSESEFEGYSPQSIQISFCLDGTANSYAADSSKVFDDLTTLINNIYDYKGSNHEPNRVALEWGKEIFYGRLKDMSYDHKLFKPDGSPLKTQVCMAFVECKSTKEMELKKNTSSPDLSHVIEVKAGDTLPLLCHRIYKNSDYCHAIARVNNLAHVGDIKAGTQLLFPPLEK